jgi:putative ABC transport system substrate-binding protein
MRRREALRTLLALAAASVPLGARAQAKPARIGYLGPSTDTAPHLIPAFREGLAALGYVEGKNLVIEFRFTNVGTRMTDDATLTANARELVALKVDVIAASIDPAIVAASKVAGSVPIVMLNATDPVALGLAETLSHPGRNITGMTRLSPELIAKNVEILLETLPHAKRIALLIGPNRQLAQLYVRNAKAAAQSRHVALQVAEVRDDAGLDAAVATLKRDAAEGVVIGDTGAGVFWTERVRLADLLLTRGLPTIFANTENVEAGGLMAYSPSSVAHYRRAAVFIDKILRGTRAGDIPIEQPTTFDLAVNMKTAKALGVVFPPSLLIRADRVIE